MKARPSESGYEYGGKWDWKRRSREHRLEAVGVLCEF